MHSADCHNPTYIMYITISNEVGDDTMLRLI